MLKSFQIEYILMHKALTFAISLAVILLLSGSLVYYFLPNGPNLLGLDSSDEDKEPTYYSFLALGDSYTIGEAVNESERWPVQLVNRMDAENIFFDDPQIIARTGWTTDQLKEGIRLQDRGGNIQAPYDLVSLLIGVNNQFRGYRISTFEKDFEFLVQEAIAYAGDNTSRVIVVSIPDYTATPVGDFYDRGNVSGQIDEYNLVKRNISETYNLAYFDITGISREAEYNEDLIAGDGLHPSGLMYSRWVDLIAPYIISTYA